MPRHRWLIQWEEDVPEQISALQQHERMGLLSKLADLLTSEDPFIVAGVEYLQEKRFRDCRRIRQGNYRMLFTIEPGEVVHQKTTYKGKLIVLSVTNRRDTYKRK